MPREPSSGSEPPRPPDPAAGGGSSGRKAFLMRVPPELLEELRGWANQELRSLNAHIEYLLREALRRRRGGS